jgi:hypothetical protein
MKSNLEKEKESFKRYNDFRTVKVNSDRIDFDLSCDKVEDLIKTHHSYYDGISTYSFNIFEFSRDVGRNM